MAPSMKRFGVLLGAALAAGTVLTTASPAQAWCTAQPPNPPVTVVACSNGYCRVGALGETLYTCP